MLHRKLPENYRLIYAPEKIQERATALALEIDPWAKQMEEETGNQLLAVCVLRGAVFFCSDLLKSMRSSVEPAFCSVSSYNVSTNQLSEKGITVSVEQVPAHGRAILIIDDICDTGGTLKKLHNVFLDLGAHAVRSAVLIHRATEECTYEPVYSGFEYSGPEWFVGYGLDDQNCWRNLPGVYTIT